MIRRFHLTSISISRVACNISIPFSTHFHISRFQLGRPFHSSRVCAIKQKKKTDTNSDQSAPINLPDIKLTGNNIDKILSKYSIDISKLRTAGLTVDTVGNIPFEGYGSISKAGQVTLKSASKITVTLYDSTMVKPAADAIKSSDLNLTPAIEGSVIHISIPKPSKEARDAIVKGLGRMSEKVKLDIRQNRKDYLDNLKKCKGAISGDDIKNATKNLESLIEKKIDQISKMQKEKEKEIISN